MMGRPSYQICRTAEIPFREYAVDSRLLLCSECVQFASDRFEAVDDMTGTASACAFEDRVLNKMRQPFLARLFVAASGSDGHTEILHIPGAGNVEKSQPCRKGHVAFGLIALFRFAVSFHRGFWRLITGCRLRWRCGRSWRRVPEAPCPDLPLRIRWRRRLSCS